MSVDWSRYSTAEETRCRARKNPEANAVLELNVGNIRNLASLNVAHSPIPENKAHADVFLPKNKEDLTEARYQLTKIATVSIPFGPTSV
jgi:hypothetical protein